MRHLHIRPLQPSNDRSPKIHALHDGDKSLSNGVAAYDTTEDVDEDGGDFRVAGDEIEGLLDRLRRGSATNIKKIGGSASIEFDYVHGCHCKTGAVDYHWLKGYDRWRITFRARKGRLPRQPMSPSSLIKLRPWLSKSARA